MTRHVNSEKTNNYWNNSILCIRRFYPDVKIIIIDDNSNYEFVKAVDGRDLTPTNEIKEMFEGNCFFYRKAVIGCALSHINLWKRLVEDDTSEYYTIIEDDVQLASSFSEKLNIAVRKFKEEQADFLYLGAFSIKDQNIYANKLEIIKKEGEKCECTFVNWGLDLERVLLNIAKQAHIYKALLISSSQH
jgi:GR25 family glycosyltransferase involved in LPS biosynthesis